MPRFSAKWSSSFASGAASQWLRVIDGAVGHSHRLLGGRKFDSQQQLPDHLVPGIRARGHASAAAYRGREAGTLLDQVQLGNELDRLVCLDNQSVSIRSR